MQTETKTAILMLTLKDALEDVKKDIQSFECLNDLLDTADQHEEVRKVLLFALLESLIQKLSLDVDYAIDVLEQH